MSSVMLSFEGKKHTCPKDFVENRNISNILEEAPLCAINWNLADSW